MACGVCGDGGILIEKIGREQSRLFFVVGMVGEGVAGVFQGGSGYPLSGLVSAFSHSSSPTSQSVKCFYLTLISNFYFLETEVTIVSLMVTIIPDYLPTPMGGCFQILIPQPFTPRM